MAETGNIRMERIEKLLRELEYEVTRGMLEHEIDETMGFQFVVPLSRAMPDGVVWCEFRTRPTHRHNLPWNAGAEPRLYVVKS